jgi:primosomal protein N'
MYRGIFNYLYDGLLNGMAVRERESPDEIQCPWCGNENPIRMDICPHCETMLH